MRGSAEIIAAGDLPHRVRVEVPQDVEDDTGGATRTWALLREVWAKVSPLTASEQLQFGRPELGITHTVRMRHLAGVTGKARVVFGSRILHVVGPTNPNESNRVLVLTCQERAA